MFTHLYAFLFSTAAATLLIMFLLLPFEETGALGRIPTRINNFFTYFGPACIVLGMLAYWLR